ncbi:S1 family peptidase [Stutzerimonas stutzeri]|uniref:S1 family peptidase n=1 Tax=Stutzerimonas stutzeri TaxID=316 RepID=UPI003C2BB9FD
MNINNQLSISEQLMSCTVRIVSTAGQIENGSGSSFLMAIAKHGDHQVIALVTNKHVIENANGIKFVLSHSAADGSDIQHAEMQMEIDPARIIYHPGAIDLCAIPISWAINYLVEHKRNLRHVILDEAICAKRELFDEILPLDSVVMIGYPNGLWDEVNNGAIARRGTLASNPGKEFKGKPDFVVDMACFPGSSGSPIFLLDNGSYSDRSGNTILGGRCALLGVLHSGPTANVNGTIEIAPVPTGQVPFARFKAMLNLGYAVKITELEPIRVEALARLESELNAQ